MCERDSSMVEYKPEKLTAVVRFHFPTEKTKEMAERLKALVC
jgi:hypothetical protein